MSTDFLEKIVLTSVIQNKHLTNSIVNSTIVVSSEIKKFVLICSGVKTRYKLNSVTGLETL